MSKTTKILNSTKLEPGYLKFYMSHTAFFLEGGYLIDVPVEGFRPFVFTDILFIKQGLSDTAIENKYGDAVLINSGDAQAYQGMTTKKIASIQSRMD